MIEITKMCIDEQKLEMLVFGIKSRYFENIL